MGVYEIISVEGGLIETEHPEYKRQVWALAKLRKHKTSRCAICGREVGAVGYRPITNGYNRMHRICLGHIV